MSKYTTEVRYICETIAEQSSSQDAGRIEDMLTIASPVIFADSLSSIPQAQRTDLPKKILRHYYTREIGYETVGLWKFKLNAKMNEIMPYYSKLYESAELLIIDENNNPINDVDYTREITTDDGKIISSSSQTNNERNRNSQNAGNSITNDDTWNKFQDTPQGRIADIKAGTYLSNAREITDENESAYVDSSNEQDNQVVNDVSNGIENRNVNTTETVKGKMFANSKAKLLKEYRDTILNIDMMIINELNDLFMLLWWGGKVLVYMIKKKAPMEIRNFEDAKAVEDGRTRNTPTEYWYITDNSGQTVLYSRSEYNCLIALD